MSCGRTGRLDAKRGRLRARIGARGVDGFLHHVAEFAGRLEASLAGDHDGLDGQRLATHFGPRKSRHHTNLVLAFHLAIAELPDARIFAEIFSRDLDGDRFAGDNRLHRLAREICQFAFDCGRSLRA